jgi:hypothetical protein
MDGLGRVGFLGATRRARGQNPEQYGRARAPPVSSPVKMRRSRHLGVAHLGPRKNPVAGREHFVNIGQRIR